MRNGNDQTTIQLVISETDCIPKTLGLSRDMNHVLCPSKRGTPFRRIAKTRKVCHAKFEAGQFFGGTHASTTQPLLFRQHLRCWASKPVVRERNMGLPFLRLGTIETKRNTCCLGKIFTFQKVVKKIPPNHSRVVLVLIIPRILLPPSSSEIDPKARLRMGKSRRSESFWVSRTKRTQLRWGYNWDSPLVCQFRVEQPVETSTEKTAPSQRDP